MARPDPVIELYPSQLVIRDPARKKTWSAWIEQGDGERSWVEELAALDESLATGVEELGLAGARVTVAYKSSHSIADITSVPIRGAGACEAACLAVSDAVGLDGNEIATGVTVCGCDAADRRMSHILAFADRAENVEAVRHWAERSGCVVRSVVPGYAHGLQALLQRILENPGKGAKVTILVDEHATCLGATIDKRLVFVRLIEIGLSTLAQPIASLWATSTSTGLLPHQCVSRLASIGIPQRNTPVDEELGLIGADVLPLIQPVLQRLIVEIKHSVRFNMPNDLGKDLSIVLTGPGANLPRLGDVLAEELELAVACDRSEHRDDGPPVTRKRRSELTLRTRDEIVTASAHGMRRALIGGAVAACAVLAVDGWATLDATARARAELARVQPEVQQLETTGDDQRRREELADDARESIDLINARIGPRTLFGGALFEIARLRRPGITLSAIRADNRNRKQLLRVNGYVSSAQNQTTTQELRTFIADLEQSPLIDRVQLGATRRTNVPGGQGVGFDLVLELNGAGPVLAIAEDIP